MSARALRPAASSAKRDRGVLLVGELALAQAPRRRPARLGGEQAVLAHGEGQQDVGALIAATEAAAGDLVGGPAGDVLAVEADAPGAGLERAGEKIDEGGLAGAVRADDAVHLVGVEGERHAVHGDETAEAAGQVLDGEAFRARRLALAHDPSLRRRGGCRCRLAGKELGDPARGGEDGGDQRRAEPQRPVIGDQRPDQR